MATGDVSVKPQSTWPLANPWPWVGLGLTLALMALIWGTVWGEWCTGGKVGLIFAAMICSGGAVALRWNSSHDAFLQELSPVRRSQALFAVLVLLAGVLLASIYFVCSTTGRPDYPWSVIQARWLFGVVAPVTAALGFLTFDRMSARVPVTPKLESAMLMALLGLTAFLSCGALFIGAEQWTHWFSIRTFLSMAAAAAFVAAGICMLPTFGRKVVISGLILFHFGGILTAILSTNSPFLVRHLWSRVYRPYLEFLYLNNSYQFYAPEPGPSAYMWFRVEYKNQDGTTFTHWEELPKLDEYSRPDYPLAINYQRRVALAELLLQGTTNLSPTIIVDGEPRPNPRLLWRKAFSSQKEFQDAMGMLARVSTKSVFPHPIIPMHPNIRPVPTQYREPSPYNKLMISSMARHVLTHKHPDVPDAKPYRVKIYHVVHSIPPSEFFAKGHDPHNPVTYQPRYMGLYDVQGKLLDEPVFDENGVLISGDPYLYWIVPILSYPLQMDLEKAEIHNFAYLHAGENKYVRYPGEDQYKEFTMPQAPPRELNIPAPKLGANPLFPPGVHDKSELQNKTPKVDNNPDNGTR